MATYDNSLTVQTTPDETWRGQPSDSDNISDGADAIRNTRATSIELFSQEHYIEPSGTNESTGIGHHIEGSARVFVRNDGRSNYPTSPDNTIGEVKANKDSRSLEVYDGSGWFAIGGVFPGLIAYSAVEPVPAEDGWVLCDGRNVTETQDGGIYASLIERLNPGGTQVTLPNLQNEFIRGAPADGSRDPNAATGTYDKQDHAIEDHFHGMDHGHGQTISNGRPSSGTSRTGDASYDNGDGSPSFEYETGNWEASEGTGASLLTADGVLSLNDPGDTAQVNNGLMPFNVADDNSKTVDLSHYHLIPEYRGWTMNLVNTLAVTEDVNHGINDPSGEFNVADETRPANVALYVIMKL